MIVEIQCLPSPPGTNERRYAHVEAAIEVVRSSGLQYEVGPLGTSIQGQPDEVWALIRLAHEACLAAGADSLVSVIKVEQTARRADQPTMGDLVDPWRS